MNEQRMLPALLLGLMVAGCGGGKDGDTGGDADGGAPAGSTTAVVNPPASSGASGLDLAGYPTRTTVDSKGGSVTVANGPILTVPAGALATTATIGMRPATAAPSVGAPGYTVASAWYELATSNLETVAQAGTIALDIPATPGTDALNHPGLQLLAQVDGVTLPVDGTFDTASGKFHVELLGLPPSFAFAVAFNPNIQRLSTDDPSALLDILAPAPGTPVVPWSTLDFWVVFDGNVVKMEGVKKVLAWARTAATAYSNAGLKEPFLRKDTVGAKSRWYLHLTTDGSYFSEGVAADHGLFGRQYMSVARIGSLATDPLGSGLASIAHEMFHAVFRSYGIPNLVFCDQAGAKCRRSYAGVNEGMATAAGYWIDQGSPAKPRPNQIARPLWWPFAWFSPAQGDTMYMNQDFYVYLLRVGTLANFRMHLEALAGAVVPANADFFTVLAAYGAALDLSDTGFGGNFTQTWAWYAADRLYARTADGWLWPGEPAGAIPGTGYVLDASLLDVDSHVEVTSKDCTEGSSSLDCSIIVSKRFPLGPMVVSAKVDGLKLPSAIAGKPLTGTFDAIVSGGSSAFTVFGEKNGKGSASAAQRSPDGFSVKLENVGTDYPTVHMVVIPSGAPNPKVMVEMSFSAPSDTAKVWILCEGVSGSKETYGCVGWDGDTTFAGAGDECLFAGYMTDSGQFTTRAACTAECVSTADATGWRTCLTP